MNYAIDNIGGGTDGRCSDGIPDNQEAVVYYTTSNEAYSTVASVYQTFNFDSANASSTALDAELAVTAGNIYNVIANFGSTGTGSGGGGGTTGGGDTTIEDNEVSLAGDTQLNRDAHFTYVSSYEDNTVRPTNNITRKRGCCYLLSTTDQRVSHHLRHGGQ